MQERKAEKTISSHALSKLIAAHDGDVALLYLHWLQSGSRDAEQAAAALCRTMREIAEAEEKLQRMGLLDESARPRPAVKPPLDPEEELPQYPAADLTRRGQEDPAFSAILAEGARVIGHNLSSNDMRVLFGVYDYLGLPAEVIFMLLGDCADQFAARYGTSRRPSAKAIEKAAYEWARQEILTLEQAESYIAARKERQGEIGRIKAVLNIYDRALSATEEKYIRSWLDMGFHEDAVAIAYDRTLTQTSALKGVHTAKEIEEKDGRRSAPAQRRDAKSDQKPVDMDALRRIIDKI